MREGIGSIPILGDIFRYFYWLLTTPMRINRLLDEVDTLRRDIHREVIDRADQTRGSIEVLHREADQTRGSMEVLHREVVSRQDRLEAWVQEVHQAIVKGSVLNIGDLRTQSRSKIEEVSRAACRVVHLGDATALCRVLTRYLMYVCTTDRSLTPHMMMNGFWETWITQAIVRYLQPGMRVADIGANLGYYSLLLADCVGPEGRVWSVEPNPLVYELMRQSMEINDFLTRSALARKACSSTDGEAFVLKVPVMYQGSATTGANAFHNYPDLELTEFECQTVRLDTLIGEDQRLDFVKIDAEGAERNIWQGMRGLLRSNPDIVVVMEFESSRYTHPAEFVDEIAADGFKLRFIDFDAMIRDITVEQLLAKEDWSMLWLQRGESCAIAGNAVEDHLHEPARPPALAAGFMDPPGEFHWSIRHRGESPPGAPRHVGLTSKLCQSVDFDQPLYHYWCGSICENPVYHRKQWEFAFIAQALWERGLLAEGRSGVGFGVGQEPLPALFASMGCRVLATDLEKDLAAAAGWATTRQYAEDIRLLNKRGICDPKLFHARVSVRYVNMNEIPADLGEFDFCWSSCSLEHLGSIKHGQQFIENSLDCLKPGGLAVHTTEYNISSNDQTVETGPTVLFRRRDIEEIVGRVTAAGHTVEPVSFDPGSEPVDKYLDLPPYRYEPHLKLWFDGFTTTSIALIIRKAQGES